MPLNEDQILLRFDRLDDKLDDFRRELMASFVLKQVFDAAIEARDKELKELKEALKEHEQQEMTRFSRWLTVCGGLLGIVSSILYLISTYWRH